ncbi:MAG: EamA family transporter, partial [Acidimicrobiia bacterium]|nr:EamA family transporter [Acidimicrobiia bacterium]
MPSACRCASSPRPSPTTSCRTWGSTVPASRPRVAASWAADLGAFLALLSSVSWGSGDFLGGSLSRRAHPLVVMRDAQALAFVGLIVVAACTGELDASGYLPWGAAAGAVGAVALGCFYTALSQGTMGVVAPIAATGVVVPVAVGIARGESPSVLQVIGIAVTIVGVVLAAGPERAPEGHTITRERRPLLL